MLKHLEKTATQPTEYHPEIDGLRAISILSVVAYHVNAEALPGGFIGVDVFFVISGFLIINQIIGALSQGTFALADFWSRRALRILPPYFLVIGASIIIAQFILVTPDEFRQFAKEAATSSIFAINHLFLNQQGYFDTAADAKILLNLWSLSVEEQFYIAAPFLLIALWALAPRWRAAASALIFVISFVACVWFTATDRNYAFFIMPLRAWEFIAGGAVIFLVPYAARLPRFWIEIIGLAGLVAIIAAATRMSDQLFPSYKAALPVFGAAAIILAGIAHKQALVARALSMAPLVRIGLVSYAWYLWHWPLITFGRIYNFGDHVLWLDTGMAAVSFLLAVATHILVEKPVLQWRKRNYRVLPWRPAIVGILSCMAIASGSLLVMNGAADDIAGSTPATMLPTKPAYVSCNLNIPIKDGACAPQKDGRTLGLLWGDSQAAAALGGLEKLANEHGVRLASFASGGCPPFYGVDIVRTSKNCASYRAVGIPRLDALKIEFAILYARWPIYATGAPSYALAGQGDNHNDQETLFIEGLRASIEKLTQMGAKKILVIGPTPTFPRDISTCYARAKRQGIDPSERCYTLRSDQERDNRIALTRLFAAVQGSANVRLVDPSDAFCDRVHCRPFNQQALFFNDTNHISDFGVSALTNQFAPVFDWLFG